MSPSFAQHPGEIYIPDKDSVSFLHPGPKEDDAANPPPPSYVRKVVFLIISKRFLSSYFAL